MLRYLLVGGFLTCVVSLSLAAPPWEERHGLTADDFEKTSKDLGEKGYSPIHLSAAVVGKEVRFAAVWEKRPDGPAVEARHDLTAKQYEKTADELKKKGFRPVHLSGYEANGEARFTAVWEKEPKDAPAWEAYHDLTSDDYRKLYADLTKKGSRPLRVSGYVVGKETRYATIWEKEEKNGPTWHTRRDLTAAQYQDVFNEQLEKKHRLIHVAGYTIDGEERFAGVWEKSAALGWHSKHGMDAKQYEAALADLKTKGFWPVQVNIYAVGGQARYAGLWARD